jgi:hypothetical protein
MTFTAAEIRELSAGDGALGWSPNPVGCPPQFQQIILETRARRIGLRATEPVAPVIPAAQAAPHADVEALRAKLESVSLF